MTVRFGTFDERNSRERTTTEPTRIAKKSAAERSFKINPFIRDIEITVGEKRGQKQRERGSKHEIYNKIQRAVNTNVV